MINRSLAPAAAVLIVVLAAACQPEPEIPWKMRSGLLSRDPELRLAALREAAAGNTGGAAPLIGRIALKDPDPVLRTEALRTLSGFNPPPPEASSILVHALADPDPNVRLAAVESRPKLKTRQFEEALFLVPLLRHPDPAVRATAALALADFRARSRPYLDKIRGLLDDPDPEVREKAKEASAQIAAPYQANYRGLIAAGWLEKLKAAESADARIEAVGGLAVTGDQGPVAETVTGLVNCLADDDERLRYRAAWALMDLLPRVPGLRKRLETESPPPPADRMLLYVLAASPGNEP